MIVELCGTDLLKLVNGERIVVGDGYVVVRHTERDASKVIDGPTPANSNASRSNEQIRASRKTARDKLVGRSGHPTKTGQRWMNAIYAGGCYMDGCSNAWKKGALILYDYDTRRALCEEHGESEFPDTKPQGVKA